MKNLRKLSGVVALTLILGVAALADCPIPGQIPTPPCSAAPGQLETPPESTDPGIIHTPGAAYSVAQFTITLLENALFF